MIAINVPVAFDLLAFCARAESLIACSLRRYATVLASPGSKPRE
jgi:hypothetical protein